MPSLLETRLGQEALESLVMAKRELGEIKSMLKNISEKTANRFIIIHPEQGATAIVLSTDNIAGFTDNDIVLKYPLALDDPSTCGKTQIKCRETADEIYRAIFE